MLSAKLITTSQNRLGYPLDLGIPFTGAWSMYPLSTAATNLFTLRRVSDSAEQTIARIGNSPDTSSINSFIGASSATIKTLIDQSGNSNNATQNTTTSQPAYATHAGKSVAYMFYSSNYKYWDLPSAPSLTGRNYSIYLVFSAEDRTFTNVVTIPRQTPLIGASAAGPYTSGDSRTAAQAIVMQWGTFPTSNISLIGGNCSINIGVIRSNASNTRFVMNGLANQVATVTDSSTKALIYIGRQGAQYSDGSALIAVLVGPAHTVQQEASVISSLQTLFSTAPKTKLVLFDGDSITGGHNETGGFTDWRSASWPYQMMQAIGDQTVMASNRAISSSQLVDGTASPNKDLTVWAPYKLDAQLNTAYTKKILIVMAGRNDISVINAAGAGLTTYNRLVAYCQARKSAGWLKIIVVNAIPAKDFVTNNIDNERLDFNSRITANNLTDWDAVVDVASLNWQPGGSSDWTTNYQGTAGIHPNSAGRILLSNAVKPVLQSFL